MYGGCQIDLKKTELFVYKIMRYKSTLKKNIAEYFLFASVA